MKRYRRYRQEDAATLRAVASEIATSELDKLDEAVRASTSVWSVETERGLMAVGGVCSQTLLSDECFAWLYCTRFCDPRYMRRLVAELQQSYKVVHVVLDPTKTRAVRFAEWLGFEKIGVLEGYDHYVRRVA